MEVDNMDIEISPRHEREKPRIQFRELSLDDPNVPTPASVDIPQYL